MVLVKEQNLEGSQCHACYGGDLSILGADHPFSSESFGHKGHNNMILEEGEGSDVVGRYSFNLLPLTTCPSNSSSSSNCTFAASSSLPSEALSIVNLKALSDHRACSNFPPVLSLDHGDQMHHGSYLNYLVHDYEETAVWYDAMDQNCPINPLDMKRGTTGSQLIQANKGFEMESEYGFINNGPKDKQPEEDQFRLPYQSAIGVNGRQESIGQVTSHSRLRPCSSDDDEQSHKKLCCTIQKIKAEPSSSKDLQSIAAKNRRKRINERLRILQDLVPSATKVDLITMLENAISYVKLLQLQVKILATDEYWPTQGGKAPEVAQVKEAIDTILSSYRNSPKQQTVPCEEY